MKEYFYAVLDFWLELFDFLKFATAFLLGVVAPIVLIVWFLWWIAS